MLNFELQGSYNYAAPPPLILPGKNTFPLAAEPYSSPEMFLLTDRRATVPPIVKTVYCAEKVAHGSDLISPQLCQVKNLDGKNIRHVYLLGKNVNKPLVLSF